jgi:hypothetical protein
MLVFSSIVFEGLKTGDPEVHCFKNYFHDVFRVSVKVRVVKGGSASKLTSSKKWGRAKRNLGNLRFPDSEPEVMKACV